MKSFNEMLDDLDVGTVDPAEAEEATVLAVVAEDDRAAEAMSLKLSGVSVRSIAKKMGVSTSTIYQWIAKQAQEYREGIEQQEGINILSEQLIWLDEITRMCVYEAKLLAGDRSSFDAKTGTHKNPGEVLKLKTAANRMIQSALAAKKLTIDLQLSCGILPREPERVYAKLEDVKSERGAQDEAAVAKKTREELLEDIQALILRGRQI